MKQYGLTGSAGAGKDTAGAMLGLVTGQECEAIAAPLKRLVHTLFSVTPTDAADRSIKEAVLIWPVHYNALQDTADLYYELGLGRYMEFPEAWDQWVMLLDLQPPEVFGGPMTANKSLRQIYQTLGTEWGRTVDANIWIKMFPLGKIATDVREENEAMYLISKGYEILRILNNRVDSVNAHSSENGLPDTVQVFDVHNHSTMAHLCKELDAVVENDLR